MCSYEQGYVGEILGFNTQYPLGSAWMASEIQTPNVSQTGRLFKPVQHNLNQQVVEGWQPKFNKGTNILYSLTSRGAVMSLYVWQYLLWLASTGLITATFSSFPPSFVFNSYSNNSCVHVVLYFSHGSLANRTFTFQPSLAQPFSHTFRLLIVLFL